MKESISLGVMFPANLLVVFFIYCAYTCADRQEVLGSAGTALP